MGILLNCQIPNSCRFDRKHYFYADMPAGYQITQSERPIAKNGKFRFSVYSEDVQSYSKEIGIIQLQLEQDSGKSIHFGPVSLIDLNRAGTQSDPMISTYILQNTRPFSGTALVEVVTTPDFSTALEAMCFVQQLRLLLMHHGICKGEMHKGQLRVDANVSLTHLGEKGVRTEFELDRSRSDASCVQLRIKNINSLRHLHTAINFEIDRHYKVISDGGKVINETRMCDEHGRTVSMRDKEVKTDYRFIPEPNLPTLKILPQWIDECTSSISSTPSYIRYQKLGFEARRAIYYAENPPLSRFLDMCTDRLPRVGAENFVNWMNELKLILQRSKATYPPENPEFADQFMTVAEYHANGKITKLRALEALRLFATNIQDAKEYFEKANAWRITDEQMILSMTEDILKRNGKLVEKAMAGHAKSLSKLKKLLIDQSDKRIEIEDAERAVARKIWELKIEKQKSIS
ncbi:unnamed protein product [Strongylus vulgaris]|uniref:Aspartyl/Glutamyl-tRNA(Gln) amidotransferase subunit B/E catalytic domain-containing protein n=1 Tax=Strongylus vulgaris TaxID=40348 RepID=A0A3P7HZD3_STRVU|nr:unnamed protein product [Strongylus vulgaris]